MDKAQNIVKKINIKIQIRVDKLKVIILFNSKTFWSILVQFDSKKVSFGRHETFILRYSWLSKGFHEFTQNPNIFSDEDATVTLGVGKNMVLSIKAWLAACQLITISSDGRQLDSTRVGELIFDESGYDPYFEDEGTIWIIHWLLSSNAQLATAFFWFFNNYHKQEFTSDEALLSLIDFVNQDIQKTVSKNTLKQDISVLLRMYGRLTSNNNGIVEEALDSPLVLLQLISSGTSGKNFKSTPSERKALPVEIFGYAMINLMEELSLDQIPIKDLMYTKDNSLSIGSVFRLTEDALISKLERLVSICPGVFELRETAGIFQFYKLSEIKANDLLESYYQKSNTLKVA